MSDYRDRDYRDRDRRDRRDDYGGRPPLPTKSQMGSRIYIGRLPGDIREREIEKAFKKYGRVSEISLKGNYCFLVRFDHCSDYIPFTMSQVHALIKEKLIFVIG